MGLELNKIYNLDNVQGMKMMDAESVDLVVTSPPYDNLRNYKGFSFDFESVANELFRIVKTGGVIVWIVNDATINGSETGTSFKQALRFMEIGFNLHDTMIWEKTNYIPLNHNRYEQCFEYMFIISKGKPKIFNPIKVPCNNFGIIHNRLKSNKEDGSAVRNRNERTICKEYKYHKNIFEYNTAYTNYDHPAIFPEKLVRDHILTWSNEGDVVLDPFMGSGTTAKVARSFQRKYIGFEISKEYCELANKRLQDTRTLWDL